MHVRVFGGLADHLGGTHVEVALPDDGTVTVADLLSELSRHHPGVSTLLPAVSVAVDLEIAEGSRTIPAGAEVALLPPVAGGADAAEGGDGRVVVTGLAAPPLDIAGTLAKLATPTAGATALFLGTVRDHAPDLPDVVRLEYSAYEPMAERELERIARETITAHPAVTGVALLHALGDLPVGAHTVLVACTSPHRGEAFAACREALEELKSRVPVFKREVTADGTDRWVGLSEGPAG
ncbi:MAG: molybdenum cofactor biosynthesis protein MoaE [Nitriliruptoraceae bacterium]